MNTRPAELTELDHTKRELDANDLFENFDSWCQIHFKQSQKKQIKQTPSVVRSLSSLFDRMEQNNFPPSPTLPKPASRKGGSKQPALEQLYSQVIPATSTVVKASRGKRRPELNLEEEESRFFDKPPRIRGVESVKGNYKAHLATNRSSLAGYPPATGHYELGTSNKQNGYQRTRRPKSGSVNKSTEYSSALGGQQLLATQIKGILNGVITESGKRRQLMATAQNEKKCGFTGSTKLLTLSRKDYELWGTSKRSRVSPHPQSDKKSKSLSFVNPAKPHESILRSIVKKSQALQSQRPNSLVPKPNPASSSTKHARGLPTLQKSTLGGLSQLLFAKTITKAASKPTASQAIFKGAESKEKTDVVQVGKPKSKSKSRKTKKGPKQPLQKKVQLLNLWINPSLGPQQSSNNSVPVTATAKDAPGNKYFISPGVWGAGSQPLNMQGTLSNVGKEKLPNTKSARSLLGITTDEPSVASVCQNNFLSNTAQMGKQAVVGGTGESSAPALARLMQPLFKKLQGEKLGSKKPAKTLKVFTTSYENMPVDKPHEGGRKARQSKSKAMFSSAATPGVQNSTASQSSSGLGSVLLHSGALGQAKL